MEDGCTLSSSDNNQFVDAEMELFLPNLVSSDLQHLQLEGDRLARKNSLDSLKSFVMCDLQQQGKWTSPGMPDSNTSTTAAQSESQTVSPSTLSEYSYASGIRQASADREGQESSTRERSYFMV